MARTAPSFLSVHEFTGTVTMAARPTRATEGTSIITRAEVRSVVDRARATHPVRRATTIRVVAHEEVNMRGAFQS